MVQIISEERLDRIINEAIQNTLYEDVTVTRNGQTLKFKDDKEYKKFLRKEKEKAAAESGKPLKKKKKAQTTDYGIASETSPKSLAININAMINDKALKSVKTFVDHGERSFGPDAVRRLMALYVRQYEGKNPFFTYSSIYNKIKSFVRDIEAWGKGNEHAVYERCVRLADSLRDICEVLGALANITSTLKKNGSLKPFGENPSRNILIGSGDGREFGLFNLVFARGARALDNVTSKLYNIANLLDTIADNGRNPFDYKIR